MRLLARSAAIVALLAIATMSTASMADDWVATKLRGSVLQLVDGDWVKLKRGDVVPDDRVIRTMRSGNVQFKRAAETIDLGPETQIQIHDKSGKRYTVVKQYFGTVAVEAEVRNVKHFEVQTPHLAAVVKGTKFIVTSGKDGAAVKVTRGHVAVEDNDTHQSVTVAAGQSVSAQDGQSLDVAGKGDLPIVHNADGTPVITVELVDDDSGNGKKGKSGASGNGVSVNASVGGLNVSVNAGNSGNGNSGSGNNGNGNSGSGNSGSDNGNSGNSGSGNSGNGNSGNSGNGNSGSGNGGGGGNSGNGNGNGGGVASTVVGTVGGLVGGLL